MSRRGRRRPNGSGDKRCGLGSGGGDTASASSSTSEPSAEAISTSTEPVATFEIAPPKEFNE